MPPIATYLYVLVPLGALSAIYLIRKLRVWQWGWVRDRYTLEGKVFIVTGANTGLGFETTKALVARDATVIMACRSLERANAAVVKIRQKTAKGRLVVMQLDLSSFDAIKQFCTQIKTEFPRFDCLINNAGMSTKHPQMVAGSGTELTFATNHLGPFLLTELLRENIRANVSRIVVVSSMLHVRGQIDFDKIGKCGDAKDAKAAYQNSKLANFYFARELFKHGFDVHVLCPGLCNTDLFRDYNPRWYHYVAFSPIIWLMLRSAEQGAQNIIHAATDSVNTPEKNPATGYMVRNVRTLISKHSFDDNVSERLWQESTKMCAGFM